MATHSTVWLCGWHVCRHQRWWRWPLNHPWIPCPLGWWWPGGYLWWAWAASWGWGYRHDLCGHSHYLHWEGGPQQSRSRRLALRPHDRRCHQPWVDSQLTTAIGWKSSYSLLQSEQMFLIIAIGQTTSYSLDKHSPLLLLSKWTFPTIATEQANMSMTTYWKEECDAIGWLSC